MASEGFDYNEFSEKIRALSQEFIHAVLVLPITEDSERLLAFGVKLRESGVNLRHLENSKGAG